MKKIFLIDDDSDDKEIFQFALNASAIQYTFTYAADGEEALELIAAHKFDQPDYIFLDLNMPRMDGVTFLVELRKQQLYPDVPIFIYTTSSGGPDISKCLALGAQLFTKHSSFAALCSALQRQLQ